MIGDDTVYYSYYAVEWFKNYVVLFYICMSCICMFVYVYVCLYMCIYVCLYVRYLYFVLVAYFYVNKPYIFSSL